MSKNYSIKEGWLTARIKLQPGEDGRNYTEEEMEDLKKFICAGETDAIEFAEMRRYKTLIKVVYRKKPDGYLITSNKGFKVGNGEVINLKSGNTVANYYPEDGMTWLRNTQGKTTCLGAGTDPQQQVLHYYTQLEHEIKMAGNAAFKKYIA